MQNIIPEELKNFASTAPFKLYVVGGAVRDYIAGLSPGKRDWDICASAAAEAVADFASAFGFHVGRKFIATGSLKLKGEEEYEFTSFRTDSYTCSGHAPSSVTFTDDIALDARRRDFTCNAVYYDIVENVFVDPLGGIAHIAAGRLIPCAPAEKLFSEDAVRILRLARFCGELGFTLSRDCIAAACNSVRGLDRISPAWIWREFCGILAADVKYGVGGGHVRGLRILGETGALSSVFSALKNADGGAERAISAAGRAERGLRLPALLYGLGEDGARAALARYPIKKSELSRCLRLISQTCAAAHMAGETYKFILDNACDLPHIFALARSVGADCHMLRSQYEKMSAEGVPLTPADLAVRGGDLLTAGIPRADVGSTLNYLLCQCAMGNVPNQREKLLALAESRRAEK